MNESKLNINPDDMIEHGQCECGVNCYASWRDGKTVFMCEECAMYFDQGFNVVISAKDPSIH